VKRKKGGGRRERGFPGVGTSSGLTTFVRGVKVKKRKKNKKGEGKGKEERQPWPRNFLLHPILRRQ